MVIIVYAPPGVTLNGKLTPIAPRGAIKRDDVTYAIKVAITDPNARFGWNMAALGHPQKIKYSVQ